MTDDEQFRVLTDAQWELVALLLPKSEGRVGRNFANNRPVVEGMLFRLRTGIPWRDLPERFGPWQTVWKRYRRYVTDGTWDRILTALTAFADVTGDLAWVAAMEHVTCRTVASAPTRGLDEPDCLV
ncbi:transposase [Nocardia thailandica]|uniref:transposase n=1 Tax=Nocardia thailandica TaxID=257275 RepID=UPI000A0597B2|nr:transposase [Nocardia thailandica]